jgi:hypothetical protein
MNMAEINQAKWHAYAMYRKCITERVANPYTRVYQGFSAVQYEGHITEVSSKRLQHIDRVISKLSHADKLVYDTLLSYLGNLADRDRFNTVFEKTYILDETSTELLKVFDTNRKTLLDLLKRCVDNEFLSQEDCNVLSSGKTFNVFL